MMSKPSSLLNSTQSGPADQSVAVIMTCYNEGRYIGEAVRSVLSQTAQGHIHEIVIADDGSEPETVAVLKDIEQWDPRILVLYGEGGKGLPAQRNLAIANSTAGYLAILDGDDLWEATKLEKQLLALARSVDIGLVYSDFFTFHDTHVETARRAGVLDITDQTELKIAYFLNDPPIIPSTILIARKSYVASGGFDANVRVFEDTDFFIRMAAVCKFGLVNEPLLYKRNRSTSITGGRKDLMAHHAFVAFKAAATDSRLMPLVPKRLSERSRKLGNQRFLLGEIVEARQHLLLAVQLNPFNRRAWFAYIAVRFFPQIATMVRKRDVDARRTALGV
jgi:glycosyltransferase involved in cell wall biosynthesis